MTSPEEAIRRARDHAAARRGGDGRAPDQPPGLEGSITPDRLSLEQLSDWAVLEVDPAQVYSTRPWGALTVALKRLLLRLLRQYHVELEARQTRFNIAVLLQLRELDERVARIERRDRRAEAPEG